jgi:phosphoserine phosphatase RsbU/P
MKIIYKIFENLKRDSQYFYVLIVFIVSLCVFEIAGRLEREFSAVMDVATYLTWHNLFEFVSVLVSFSVFSVSYYTFGQTGRVRSIFLGSILLFTGILDAFHTLSFKGMPDFFVPNEGANRATTLWIISRLIVAFGFLITSFIPKDKKSSINKRFFVIPAVLSSVFILIIVTYFPNSLPTMFNESTGLTDIKKIFEMLIIITFVIAASKFVYEYKKTGDRLLVALAASLLLGVFCELAFVSYKNDVHHIYNYLGHVYKFVSYFIIFKVIFIYNVKQPYVDLSQAKNEIKEYAENLDRIVDKRTYELRRMNQRLLDDLEYARDIQKAILPSSLPKDRRVSFSAKYFSAERVSGDFYNIFKLDENNIGIYIGDVAGHGVPAAMLMVFVNQTIKPVKEAGDNNYKIEKPSAVLQSLYKSFNSTNFKEDIYMVLLYAVYNINERTLTYSSAGINVEPLIIHKDKSIKEIEVRGFPICKFIEFHQAEYKDEFIKLSPGDKILFSTDGLIEAENKFGEHYTEERLKQVLRMHADTNCNDLADVIENEVSQFTQNNILVDDITFFVMEVKEDVAK